MLVNTEQLDNTLRALESALEHYQQAVAEQDAVEQEIFRLAIIKGCELAQEVSFKLIRRQLREFGHSSRTLEAMPVKELLRFAAQHSLLSIAEVERWFAYRANRNNTAHNYGEGFVQATLAILPDFIRDARALAARLRTGAALAEDE
ncbi:nucleotidyltransferase substrate binding protein [Chloroflexus sp.]|uniref:nucleotidyltransferase substrate binding protein n=1 Tax=Chloroflexus sp. TaxID=1904827 RepID=UPI00298EDC44|nr:nucleotidyltransferase substrate binding protein [Chloroflexus sp.]MDW8403251.1 nucleotidyltransferase substrate binding protein [Chloroflexus sp.]